MINLLVVLHENEYGYHARFPSKLYFLFRGKVLKKAIPRIFYMILGNAIFKV